MDLFKFEGKIAPKKVNQMEKFKWKIPWKLLKLCHSRFNADWATPWATVCRIIGLDRALFLVNRLGKECPLEYSRSYMVREMILGVFIREVRDFTR